jgi:putative ATP-dependent endonuclease of the OLD family
MGMSSGIRICEVRIRNFRSLKFVNVELDRTTILIGENNSGKTSFLEALVSAIGGLRQGLTADDIFLESGESSIPKDRHIIVDVLVRPTNGDGKRIDYFPAGGYWTQAFGSGIRQDDDDLDFVGIRATLKWNKIEGDYKVERGFLKEWPKDPQYIDALSIDNTLRITPALEPLVLFFMDAKRDIEDDMRRQKSIWGKITSDLGLPLEFAREVEGMLNELNSNMIDNSEVLTHLTGSLQILNNLVAGEDEGVKISPIARSIRDLAKGIGLDFTTKGSQTFPLARHGMGTKSLASMLVLKSFLGWRVKKALDDKIHPILALEEPEAHLHPQAQRALISQLEDIPGQLIISTHSPYVAAQSEIQALRHFSKNGPNTIVSKFEVSGLNHIDIGNINRFVMNSRGDMLFARAIVLFEGPTEEIALPIFAEKAWGKNINMCGISLIGVGGAGNYLPFIRIAVLCNIPWFIFADGETDAINKLKDQLSKIGINDISKEQKIFIIPDGNNYEKYLIKEGYGKEICEVLNEVNDSPDYLKDFINKHDGEKLKGGISRDYKSSGGEERAIADALMKRKVEYSLPIAKKIVALKITERNIPPLIKAMFKKVADEITLN